MIDVTTHQHLTRQLDLIPVSTLHMPVTIIGCGAIGSFLGLQLAKMGMTDIKLYDFDTVSVENMSNQFFRFKDIGTNKAAALSSLINDFTGVAPWYSMGAFDKTSVPTTKGIVVVAVDSMAARRMIYEAIREEGFNVKYIIDPRMGSETYLQYTMNPFDSKDNESYLKTFYTDNEAVQERCTAKSTVYTASLAAGVVTKTIKNILLKQPYPRSVTWNIAASRNPLVMYPGGQDVHTDTN